MTEWGYLGQAGVAGIAVYFVGKGVLRGFRAFGRPLPRFKRSNPVEVLLGKCMCIQCQYYRQEGPAYTPAPKFQDPPHALSPSETFGAFQKLIGRRCAVPPPGWWCSREPGHEGPCAARPI